MNAFTNTITLALCALTFTLTNLSAALAQPAAEAPAAEAPKAEAPKAEAPQAGEAEAALAAAAMEIALTVAGAAAAEAILKSEPAAAPQPEHTYASADVSLGKALAATITAGAREQKCLLVTVVASEQSYSRDLALFSRSDLAAGALVSAEMIIDEAGAISAIVGLNAQVELMEDNSVDVFGRRLYVSYAHKAHGKGIDEFTKNAAKAGFAVMSTTSSCNSSTRLADLKKAAKEHVEILRKESLRKAKIARR